MAAQPGDPEALQLYQIIGAPLLAIVQAEAQAAQTSADFIKRVGFTTPPEGKDALLQSGGQQGELRMMEFTLDRAGADGTMRSHTVKIPVLSLFPIPLLQIKDAEFDFGIRILSRVPLESPGDQVKKEEPKKEEPGEGEQNVKADTPQEKKKPVPQRAKDYLAPEWVELKGMLSPHPGTAGSQTSEMNLRVKVRMEQADIPAGLLKLLTIMDQAVTTAPAQEPSK